MKHQLLRLFSVSIFFFILLHFCLSSQAEGKAEIRGVWLTNVDSQILFTKDELEKGINQLAKFNFNILYPTVWNWGYTLYPSLVAQKATGVLQDPTEELQGRNVLKEIVTKGHQKKMKVIPWLEFGFMAPLDSQLSLQHPEWLTARQDGTTVWLEGGVHQRVWLNPLHPQVQELIKDLIIEIVSQYDVDGIQVDDHFGYPSDFGYDPYTVALYQKSHQGQSPPTNYKDQEWIQWRGDLITEYMEDLVKCVKQANPKAIISVSPNPQTFSLESYLLDWFKWYQKGLIDQLVLQVYRNNMTSFIREISQPEVLLVKDNIPFAIGIITGVKGSTAPLSLIEQQVQETRKRGFAGVSFFFYESLWNFGSESLEERQEFWRSIFPSLS